MSNPSHILIARNSRSSGNNSSSAALSSPTETRAAASGVFRSSGSPQLSSDGYENNESPRADSSIHEQLEDEIDGTFTLMAKHPGTIKIIVENTVFWAHRDILIFASPFFEGVLSGDWSETTRPQSVSSIFTITPQSYTSGAEPHIPSDFAIERIERFDPEHSDISEAESTDAETTSLEALNKLEGKTISSSTSSTLDVAPSSQPRNEAKDAEFEFLLPPEQTSAIDVGSKGKEKEKAPSRRGSSHKPRRSRRREAVIILKEEQPAIFHDFLKFVYPHLECTIAWNNVEGLMAISHKLIVPSLQTACLNFLLSHAAGKPIKAMRIGELFGIEDLYREASRYVLDNPGGWTDPEMNTLTQETLLKLERRRTWFLERVLKLGLVNIAKEYQCCSSCINSGACAQILDDKFRQAYQMLFRFGPCQPSMVYRYLRTLEGVNPPLTLTHLSCQNTAKSFLATLFDRMFSLNLRGSGSDTVNLGGKIPGGSSGPRKQFLHCTLKPDNPLPKQARNVREGTQTS